ncbi:MAG TPA: amino acid permease [Anaerolineae bacterium]|nr:amino acid permease [Anaerolineae bacterium]HPL26701.1 amino acid permease [Anaerolineae bacterium]
MGRGQPQLGRHLGFFDTIAVALGAIIGAGIFVVLGEVASAAGAAVSPGVLLAGLVAILNGLSAAQLGVAFPRIGGTYEFGYVVLWPWVGFGAGLLYLFGNLAGSAALSLTFASYLQPVVPGVPPRAVAIGMVVAAAAVNLAGAQQSRRVNNVLVVFKVAVLAALVGVGLAFVNRWQPLAAQPFRLAGIPTVAALFFFAYSGFARPVTIVEEVRDPARNLPRSIVLAIAITAILYLAVSTVSLGLAGVAGLAGQPAPLRAALLPTGQGWAVFLVSLGAVVATADVLLTGIWALSRVVLAMVRRGDLPAALGRMNGRGVPWVAVLATGGITIVISAAVGFGAVLAAASLGTLVYYAVTNWAALRLARGQRLYPRVVPIAGLIGTVALAGSLPLQPLIVLAAVLAIGLAYFFLWHRWRRHRR